MAEYKALAQNTLKITTEMTLNHNTELGAPLPHNHPRIKCLSQDKTQISYLNLLPSMSTSTTSETGVFSYKGQTAYKKNNKEEAIGSLYDSLKNLLNPLAATPVVVDGVTYYGQKSACYSGAMEYAVSNGSTEGTIQAGGTLLGATIKVVMYVAATGTIVTKETTCDNAALEVATSSATNSYFLAVGRIPMLRVKKETNDVVLAIEIEYPKYDVTIANTKAGLQYSIDDGVTFQDVTEGMALDQVEHVVFKKTGAGAVNIGTTAGAADIAILQSGQTRVVVPEADGTWYLSQ